MRKAVIADIGGTNARFAIVGENGKIEKEKVLKSGDFFAAPKDTVHGYLNSVSENIPDVGIFAIAGPVFGGRIENKDLHFSYNIKDMGNLLEITDFDIINDFSAQALSIPYLSKDDFIRIGKGGNKIDASPIAVLGPGTGLGAGILVPLASGEYKPIATEGGHVNVPLPSDSYLMDLVLTVSEMLVKEGKTHISAEDLVSGRGLPHLYAAVKKLKNEKVTSIPSNEKITEMMCHGDADACAIFNAFFALLGIISGNYAISSGAVGGFYLSGGILLVPEIYKTFLSFDFRRYFENKGAASVFAASIPTYLITHKYPAFLGLSSLAAERIARKK